MERMIPRAVPALAVALLLLAAGCAQSRVPDPVGVPEGAPFVAQDGLAFSPGTLRVRAGERVWFWNGETAVHNLVFDGDARSPDMEAGDLFVWRFAEPGEHAVTCDYHPQMRLRVLVRP